MRRRVPVPADVRLAIADARRGMRAAAESPPASTTVEWVRAGGACRFCGEDADVFGPAKPGTPAVLVCARTLAELVAIPPVPGPGAADVIDVIEAWMAPRDGEPESEPWPAPPVPCGVCGRPAAEVPALFVGEDVALCSDCASHAAEGRIDLAARDEIAGAEIEQARQELDDLDRIRREVQNDAGVRRNATAALSLLRLLAIPDAPTQQRLRALVRALGE